MYTSQRGFGQTVVSGPKGKNVRIHSAGKAVCVRTLLRYIRVAAGTPENGFSRKNLQIDRGVLEMTNKFLHQAGTPIRSSRRISARCVDCRANIPAEPSYHK